MPITLPENLPAFDVLSREGVMVMSPKRAQSQEIRPLRIGLLNLMPKKIQTENQFARLIGATPLQIDFQLIKMSDHVTRNTAAEHMEEFYRPFSEVAQTGEKFDGLIITGAPIEQIPFEEGRLLGRVAAGVRVDAKPCVFHLRRVLGRHGDGASFPRRCKTRSGSQGIWLLSPSQLRARLALSARVFR